MRTMMRTWTCGELAVSYVFTVGVGSRTFETVLYIDCSL